MKRLPEKGRLPYYAVFAGKFQGTKLLLHGMKPQFHPMDPGIETEEQAKSCGYSLKEASLYDKKE